LGFEMDPEFEKASQVVGVISTYLHGFARVSITQDSSIGRTLEFAF